MTRKVILSILGAIFAVSALMARDSEYRPDILGDGFECKILRLRKDYSGDPQAILIRKLCATPSNKSVFYLHGYNDYFFQREMAEQFLAHGYNFYAIDLRRYGRSWREGELHFDIRTLKAYFEEVGKSLQIMREEGSQSIVAIGHSTGGLTLSLYAKHHSQALPIDALILNSPFMDMNLGGFVEAAFLPLVSSVGSLVPTLALPSGGGGAYAKSLLKEYHGEWEFDTSWKRSSVNKMTFGWVHAILEAQREIQKGANIPCPILLMYSSKTVRGETWTPEHQISDSVLDVTEIKNYGELLGSSVTSHEVKDGLHDLFLSKPQVRDSLYSYIFSWLAKKTE